MHPDDIVLNDYVDDALERAERAEVDRHLTTCVQCRRTVEELRELARRVSSLPPVQPPARAWRRIEADFVRSAGLQPRVDGDGERAAKAARYVPSRYGWIAALAAAAVLVLVTVVGFRYARGTQAPATPAAPDAQTIASELALAEEHYQKAINGLEQIANAEKGTLDPRTAVTLQKNLAVIDQAISESRAALKAQPNSEPAQQSLIESFKSKIALLQDTVALINEMRKGNDAGAARILKEKS
jgi:putative zinc finger protein